MDPWVWPTVSASIVVFLVVVGFAIYVCRRIVNGATPMALKWSSSVNDTGLLMLQEQMLDRFILFQLNFGSLVWSSEHNITHCHRFLVYVRRGLNILAVILGVFAIDVVNRIWRNWCCYPVSATVDDLVLGTCWNKSAPIVSSEGWHPCLTMDTWEWASNVAFLLCIVLSLGLHGYLSFRFVHDVRFGLEGNYTGFQDAIKGKSQRLKDYVWMCFDHHTDQKKNNPFSPHEIHLHRLSHLLVDPFSIIFGFPHIVLSRSDLAIANFINLATMVGTWMLYFQWAVPLFQEECCYYDASTRTGRFGKCNDPHSAVSRDPFRADCSVGSSLSMKLLGGLGIIQILLTIGLWLYSLILFHYLLHKISKHSMQKLEELAEQNEKQSKVWLSRSKMPSYGK